MAYSRVMSELWIQKKGDVIKIEINGEDKTGFRKSGV